MSTLYPLKLKPIFKQKIWGGNKMASLLKQHYAPLNNCGELWLISGLEEQASVVTNGFLQGNTLPELLETYMTDLVGEKVYEKFGNEFPLLFKLINAEDFLSVQVHPNDALAMERHDSLGKTELWYVLDADSEAILISGFEPKTDSDAYLKHLKKNTLAEILHYDSVKAGDAFYVPAGLVHAVGPGILLAEIQQSSDITYRIYDWNRLDVAGLPRQLHTDLALDAINFGEPSHKSHPHPAGKGLPALVHDSEYFTVNLFELNKKLTLDYCEIDSFVAFVCTEGSFELNTDTTSDIVNAGEAILLPADTTEIELVPKPACKILETYIK